MTSFALNGKPVEVDVDPAVMEFYSHAVSQDRMAAAGEMLSAILGHESGLRAD